MKFGNEVQAKRREKAMTQDELTEACDLSTRHLSAIEHGKTNPKLETIAKLAKTLDLDLNILKNNNDEETVK